VIATRDDAAAAGFADAFESAAPSQMAQSVSVLRGGRFSSYRLGDDSYWTGAISPWKRAEFLLEDSPWLVAIVVAIVCFLFAVLLQARLRRRARERLQVAV
jgi:cellulose synthase (UDP-forming)